MSTLEEASARRAGVAGAKNNTRGVLDRPGTQLLRLRPTLSPQLLRGVGGVEQRSVVEADRLLVAAVPMAPSRRHRDPDATCIFIPLTRNRSTLLAFITAHST